jgi:4-carboxymuconolactone decarboxylase
METHTYAALKSGELTLEELDEAVMFFATQMGWPRGSELSAFFASAVARIAEERGEPVPEVAFERWAPPVEESVRRARGQAAYEAVRGEPAPAPTTAFRKSAYLDFLYGEVWTRSTYLTNRDRRLIVLACSADLGVEAETTAHLEMALRSGELSYAELQEVVVHVAVYLGWLTARRLDDLLVRAAESVGALSD